MLQNSNQNSKHFNLFFSPIRAIFIMLLRERDHLGDLDKNGRIILKYRV